VVIRGASTTEGDFGDQELIQRTVTGFLTIWLNLIRHALCLQHDLQCDTDIHRIIAGRAGLQRSLDVLPCVKLPPLFRNVTNQLPHIRQRLERHHLRDRDRAGQGSPPRGALTHRATFVKLSPFAVAYIEPAVVFSQRRRKLLVPFQGGCRRRSERLATIPSISPPCRSCATKHR